MKLCTLLVLSKNSRIDIPGAVVCIQKIVQTARNRTEYLAQLVFFYFLAQLFSVHLLFMHTDIQNSKFYIPFSITVFLDEK